ncbi:hypothetical protein Bbelb_343140 [Branchiostoma belcheri]|nr:hypothetical protein Bbelb_343140 [Branchiostoma belcheri]
MASNAAAEDTHRNNDKTYSCGELLLKWVLVVLIMLAVLACMVHRGSMAGTFVPSAFGFTRAMVKEGLSSGQPSPHWTSVFLTAFVSVCEVSGLWLFTFYVLPDDSVDISTAIVLMNTVLRNESYQRQDTSSAAQEDTETADVRATIVKNFLNMVILVMTLFVVPPHGHSVNNGFNSIYLRQTEVMLSVLPAFGGVYNYVLTAPKIYENESNLFWFRHYTGLFTGQHMLLNRTKAPEHPTRQSPGATDLHGLVMICTTMYRELGYPTPLHPYCWLSEIFCNQTWDEMSQYLESIEKVATSQKLGEEYNWTGKFEAHVYFDNGVRGNKLTDFSAQLVCLVQSRYKECTVEIKKTWYGWTLQWRLPGSLQLPLYIHLKDNQEVKSKKRWSQVMYMESAVDRFDDSEVKYILATDGDVDFDADSIVAMLIQMLSDRQEEVGAVCARTHPEGSGPFVWYQMFDYGIGHWLQKVTNHVLGSVLCAPGCFSVYRVKAIASVLEEYRSDVEEASEFLTKDMGEDRWFTTLLVKAGWKVNYCAGACDSTHCPEEFDEFWKQRRRWIPSTLANQILLLKNWKTINQNNKYISMIFLLFQIVLLLSTVISPSTCILIVTGARRHAAELSTCGLRIHHPYERVRAARVSRTYRAEEARVSTASSRQSCNRTEIVRCKHVQLTTCATNDARSRSWPDVACRPHSYTLRNRAIDVRVTCVDTTSSPRGLYYGVGVPTWLSFVLFVLLTLAFALICMYYSQETQLKVAKILCFVFLIAMAIAVVGTASQMAISNTSSAPRIASCAILGGRGQSSSGPLESDWVVAWSSWHPPVHMPAMSSLVDL